MRSPASRTLLIEVMSGERRIEDVIRDGLITVEGEAWAVIETCHPTRPLVGSML